jgi:hypothetical protein
VHHAQTGCNACQGRTTDPAAAALAELSERIDGPQLVDAAKSDVEPSVIQHVPRPSFFAVSSRAAPLNRRQPPFADDGLGHAERAVSRHPRF